MSSTSLPQDVHPESGCRLPPVRRETLDATGRAAYDRLADPAGGSLVGLRGPGGIRLHSPFLCAQAQAQVAYFRALEHPSQRLQELAILVTARAHDSRFEWAAHEPAARRAGVGASAIDCVRDGAPVTGLAADEAVVVTLGRELFGAHRVSASTYAAALALLGERGLVDSVALMGHYAATAALLCAFDMQLPPAASALLAPHATS